jgi:hypothetical protein
MSNGKWEMNKNGWGMARNTKPVGGLTWVTLGNDGWLGRCREGGNGAADCLN